MAAYNIKRAEMDYKVQILSENAKVISVYPMSASLTEGTAVTMSTAGWAAVTTETRRGGIVVSGTEDSSIGNPTGNPMTGSGKPIVVVGDAIIRLHKDCVTAASLVVNAEVSYVDGKVAVAANASSAVGYVLEVGPNGDYFVIVLY